jgi:cell division protein FtsI/penicillin-binding protein 2
MWVPIQKDLNVSEKEAIEKKGFKGIGFDETPARYYPEGKLASHVLGYVGSDEKGEKTGYFGIEGRLNEYLK